MKKEAKKSFLIEQHETKNDKKNIFKKCFKKSQTLSLSRSTDTRPKPLLGKNFKYKKVNFFW